MQDLTPDLDARHWHGDLVPRNLRYVLLPDPIVPGDSRTAIDIGHLVFEWPAKESKRIPEDWFMSPQVEIEGYVSPTLPLGRIAELYFQPDTESRVRELLSAIEFGFRLGTDFDRLTVLTDKLDMQAMQDCLQLPPDLDLGSGLTFRHSVGRSQVLRSDMVRLGICMSE